MAVELMLDGRRFVDFCTQMTEPFRRLARRFGGTR